MSEKNMNSIEPSAKAAKAAAKLAITRREAEIKMVDTIGAQINQMVSTVCTAVVESRRLDMDGLESKDKKDVLVHEGTTLVALVKSNNEVIVSLWDSMAPMAAAFLGRMAEARVIEAQAALRRAQTEAKQAEVEERLAEIREEELEVKRQNAATERRKAEAAYTNGVA